MTKQEEIREGIESILRTMLVAQRNTGLASPLTFTRILRKYLHSKGVVIKAERGLPESIEDGENIWFVNGYRTRSHQYREAGYVAVEPLIEEAKE